MLDRLLHLGGRFLDFDSWDPLDTRVAPTLGDPLPIFYDKSYTHLVAVPASGQDSPIYETDLGTPSIICDGTLSYVTADSAMALFYPDGGNAGISIFFVVNILTSNDTTYLLDTFNSDESDILTITTDGSYTTADGTYSGTPATGFQILSCVFDNDHNEGHIYRNGSLITSGTFPIMIWGYTGIMGNYQGIDNKANANLKRLCAYKFTVNNLQRKFVEKALSLKYGIALTA